MCKSIANADGSEIEITPEMVEAGETVLRGFDGGYFDTPDEWVERIYRAMVRTKAEGQAPLRRFQECAT